MISAVLLSLSIEKLRSPEQLVIISDKYMRYPMRTLGNTLANSLRIKTLTLKATSTLYLA